MLLKIIFKLFRAFHRYFSDGKIHLQISRRCTTPAIHQVDFRSKINTIQISYLILYLYCVYSIIYAIFIMRLFSFGSRPVSTFFLRTEMENFSDQNQRSAVPHFLEIFFEISLHNIGGICKIPILFFYLNTNSITKCHKTQCIKSKSRNLRIKAA